MPGTFTNLLYHIVFSTKGREAIITPDLRERLYPFMGGIARDENASLLAVNGMPDHVHLCVVMRAEPSVAALVRHIKSRSSQWVHDTFPDLEHFHWQEGYAAFTVSESVKPKVLEYIANQEAHHRTRTFSDELIALLDANAVQYDSRYVFD